MKTIYILICLQTIQSIKHILTVSHLWGWSIEPARGRGAVLSTAQSERTRRGLTSTASWGLGLLLHSDDHTSTLRQKFGSIGCIDYKVRQVKVFRIHQKVLINLYCSWIWKYSWQSRLLLNAIFITFYPFKIMYRIPVHLLK